MSIFLYVVIAPRIAHSTNTRVVDLWRPLTSDLFDIFNVSLSRQQLKLKFSMSVVILFVGVQGSITDNYNASDDAALLVSSSSSSSSSSAFSLGHRTQSECHRESRPSLNAAWRGNYWLITHTSRFPFFSRTLSGLGQQQTEWKSNSKFKKREAAPKGGSVEGEGGREVRAACWPFQSNAINQVKLVSKSIFR